MTRALAVGLACASGLAAARGAHAEGEPPARLSVVSAPVGEVLVDGTPTGRSTPVTDLELPSGTHGISVRFADGRASEPTRRVFTSGRTTYVYALPPGIRSADACAADHVRCWSAVSTALRAGREAEADALAARYLERFPEGGYHALATSLRQHHATRLAEAQTAAVRRRWAQYGAAAALLAAGAAAGAAIRRRTRPQPTPPG